VKTVVVSQHFTPFHNSAFRDVGLVVGQAKPQRKKPKQINDLGFFMAEKEGFEPSIRYNRIPDFESGAFDHSATSPDSVSPVVCWVKPHILCVFTQLR